MTTSPRSPSHKERIKQQIMDEFWKPQSDEVLKSLLSSLCRDCVDGQCESSTQQQWEQLHHDAILKAVITKERDRSIYFLNNIKTMSGSQFNFDLNTYEYEQFEAQKKRLDRCSDIDENDAYKYRMWLYLSSKQPGFERLIYTHRLKSGFHRKDQASLFAAQKNKTTHALQCSVSVLPHAIASVIVEYLDDICAFCSCHLGLDFIPNHPLPRLSCYACKASAKSIITHQNALRKYPQLSAEMLLNLTDQQKSETVNGVTIYFVLDIKQLFDHDGSITQHGSDSEYFETDNELEEDIMEFELLDSDSEDRSISL